MREAADISPGHVGTFASDEVLQRMVESVRAALKGSAAVFVASPVADGETFECASDPRCILGDDAATSAMDAPILSTFGRTIGRLRVVDEGTRAWSNEDRRLLAAFAACLTSAVETKVEPCQRERSKAAADPTFFAVADRIPGLIFERRKIDASRSRYTFFGSTKSQLPAVRKMMEDGGTGDLDFVHCDDRDVVRAAMLRSNLEETDLDLTFRVKDFGRKVRWLRSQSIVRRGPDGAVAWDGLVYDISDLVGARDEAEAARITGEKLLLDVDRDLRGPLKAIVDLSEAIKTERQPQRLAAHASDLQLAADSIQSVIGQLTAHHASTRSSNLASAAAPANLDADWPAAYPRPTGGTGARILLADDLDLNRKLVADMLSLEGYVVECVENGAEAIQRASLYRFDLILMDMIMPIMDGVTATKAIRALPMPACDVPIVALTAHSTREQLDDCLAAGMDATLTKPMSIAALNAVVETWIGGRTKAA